MQKLQRNNEEIQHYFSELRDQFWGDVNQHTKTGSRNSWKIGPNASGTSLWG